MSFRDAVANNNTSYGNMKSKIDVKMEQYKRQVNKIVNNYSDTWDDQDSMKYACVLQNSVQVALEKLENEDKKKMELCSEFDEISSELERIMKSIAYRKKLKMESLVEYRDSDDLVENEKVQLEIEHNQSMILERENELKKVHQSVQQVNEIFKDLASIVADQQGTIDTIENHIQESHARTERGLEQVKKAADEQRTCCLM